MNPKHAERGKMRQDLKNDLNLKNVGCKIEIGVSM